MRPGDPSAYAVVERLAARVVDQWSALDAPDREELLCEARLVGLEMLAAAAPTGDPVSRAALRARMSRRVRRCLPLAQASPTACPEPAPGHDDPGEVAALTEGLPAAYAAAVRLRVVEGADWQALEAELGVARPFATYLVEEGLRLLVAEERPEPSLPGPSAALLSPGDFLAEARAELATALRRRYPVALVVAIPARPEEVRAVAACLCRHVRGGDLLGLLDEGPALLAVHAGAEAAQAILARLRQAVLREMALVTRGGYAVAPRDGRSLPALIAAALRAAA